jgi:hypothetical protein
VIGRSPRGTDRAQRSAAAMPDPLANMRRSSADKTFMQVRVHMAAVCKPSLRLAASWAVSQPAPNSQRLSCPRRMNTPSSRVSRRTTGGGQTSGSTTASGRPCSGPGCSRCDARVVPGVSWFPGPECAAAPDIAAGTSRMSRPAAGDRTPAGRVRGSSVRRMTMIGSVCGAAVVDENRRSVEESGLEVLQRLLCL